jgi:hypothetical protein
MVENGEAMEHGYAVTHYFFKLEAGRVILSRICLSANAGKSAGTEHQ